MAFNAQQGLFPSSPTGCSRGRFENFVLIRRDKQSKDTRRFANKETATAKRCWSKCGSNSRHTHHKLRFEYAIGKQIQ